MKRSLFLMALALAFFCGGTGCKKEKAAAPAAPAPAPAPAPVVEAVSLPVNKATKASCANNLRQLGIFVTEFADRHNGKMPASLEELKSADALLRLCSDGQTPFVYHPLKGTRSRNGKAVIVECPVHKTRLHADGHVSAVR